ncbi:LysR family transcriptional regulator [Streptomyces sp. NBC_01764]|uniref:LysR family transcriptional regulator n=1 Tax=Streptomyces sp. NBC_01764 TaxID=2975935 RepID=UPI00224EB7A9|nr:LysR family transcriptional regulator [Streptomyces sp. NBC_01764]MCX4403350.1 LysR family transcriptional regulator [Streptomyces sp. NBC_01764]
MELRDMRAFVAVVEEGALSAAARRLHMSQPRLSQMVLALEREFGVGLLVRSSTGVQPTEAGAALLTESRAVLARYDQAVAAVARHRLPGGSILRLGIPLELSPGFLTRPLAALADAYPETRVEPRHMSTAEQVAALRAGELDIGLLRERPSGGDLDAIKVMEERLGVLLAAERAAELSSPEGVRLDSLAGLHWIGFPRSGSPVWYDEVTAVLRGHGIATETSAVAGQVLLAEVKLAAVSDGTAFALAPHWFHPLPESVVWQPLTGGPLVRRTWAVWQATSHRQDLGRFVVALGSDSG